MSEEENSNPYKRRFSGLAGGIDASEEGEGALNEITSEANAISTQADASGLGYGGEVAKPSGGDDDDDKTREGSGGDYEKQQESIAEDERRKEEERRQREQEERE